MDNIIKQLKRGAKHTRLSVDEKATMKSSLLRHLAEHPAGESIFHRKSIPSPFSIRNFRNKKSLSLFVIGGLLIGGSASFAAENTVPGDVLYSVKVHVNETVRGTFAMTPKAKAEWEVRLVERRLEEVEKLATKTDVPEEIKQIASANLGKYTERVHGRIAKFEEDDDSDDAILVAGELADMFRTHEEVLAGLSTQVTGGVAMSTTVNMGANTPPVGNALAEDERPFVSVLVKLREGRGDAEEKHKELKKKYHKEDGDEDDNTVSVSQVSTMVVGTTSAETVVPTTFHVGDRDDTLKSRGDKKHEEKHEEIRAIAEVMSVVATPTGATTDSVTGVPTVKIENTGSPMERLKNSGSLELRDNDND